MKQKLTFIRTLLEHLLKDSKPGQIVVDDEHTEAGREGVGSRGRKTGLHGSDRMIGRSDSGEDQT